jgi:hypothetical protein
LRRIFGPKIHEVTGENGIMRNFIICTLSKYNENDQVKKDEVGWEGSMNGGEEECI